ncbi:hypothetical protein JDV02_003503 [Purpureocillium takamizusanense]|uniref:Uncharacterized protein n=1 Tax=Purpureocillium takamizusanense TaxID=2060973 RepID=A0A9Q8QD84_9HYPO|nr:uncharacterized protein JDV02_003503 [Purpureocillium takamizusanense]UNI17127.1 hypothetical protein JDV02_003503 [Purpureocillium takamizusanense]
MPPITVLPCGVSVPVLPSPLLVSVVPTVARHLLHPTAGLMKHARQTACIQRIYDKFTQTIRAPPLRRGGVVWVLLPFSRDTTDTGFATESHTACTRAQNTNNNKGQ